MRCWRAPLLVAQPQVAQWRAQQSAVAVVRCTLYYYKRNFQELACCWRTGVRTCVLASSWWRSKQEGAVAAGGAVWPLEAVLSGGRCVKRARSCSFCCDHRSGMLLQRGWIMCRRNGGALLTVRSYLLLGVRRRAIIYCSPNLLLSTVQPRIRAKEQYSNNSCWLCYF